MTTVTNKHGIKLSPGTVIKGKWHQREYLLTRMLGSGTVGSVYLCLHQGRYFALKISQQSISMTKEVQALKQLQGTKVQDQDLGPYLFDVDDWSVYSFYVMEYIEGLSLAAYIRRDGIAQMEWILRQLLMQLERLHQMGYVFGDLKSDNVIISLNPLAVRLVDVGGMTKMGRSVKEYTNFYDRAYWRLGSRRAEASYDLFAVAMLVLAIYYPHPFERHQDSRRLLRGKLSHIQSLGPYEELLMKAIDGAYPDARSMAKDLDRSSRSRRKGGSRPSPTRMEIVLIATSTGFYIALYYAWLYVCNV